MKDNLIDMWYVENHEGRYKYRIAFGFKYLEFANDDRFIVDFKTRGKYRLSYKVMDWIVENIEGAYYKAKPTSNKNIKSLYTGRQYKKLVPTPTDDIKTIAGTVKFKTSVNVKYRHNYFMTVLYICFEHKQDALLFRLAHT